MLNNITNKIYLKLGDGGVIKAYIFLVFILAIPSLINLFNTKCNYYTDYITCNKNPSAYITVSNFLFLFITLAAISFFYYIIILQKVKFNLSQLLIVVSLFFLMVPFGSTDVYFYRGIARGENNSNLNPYNGGFYKEIERLGQKNIVESPAAYSPIWLHLNNFIYTLSPYNENFSIIVYKLFSSVIFIVCYFYIKKYFGDRVALSFVLNPLFLFEFITNVHFDIYLVALLIFSIKSIKDKSYFLSLVFLILASLIKANALLILALTYLYIFVSLIRKEKYELLRITFFSFTTFVTSYFFAYYRYYNFEGILKGLQQQSFWLYNSIQDLLNDSRFNPLSYTLNGKLRYLSYGFYQKFFILFSTIIISSHIAANCNFSKLFKRNININFLLFYLAFINFCLVIFISRSYLPWYLSWSSIFLIFIKIKSRNLLLFLNTLGMVFYYPFIYLIGHFNVVSSHPIYSVMLICEMFLLFVILKYYLGSRIKIFDDKS